MIKRAVVLVNLGSPAAPTPAAIKTFLTQFLSDPRVVEIPGWLWRPLLRAVILPLRSKRVTKLYEEIWTEQGSPLTTMTIRQASLLQAALQQSGNTDVIVRTAMTYGSPSIAAVIGSLRNQQIENILLVPLYPQYSGTTTGAVYDQVASLIANSRYVPDVRVVRHYCHRDEYIAALVNSVRDYRQQHGSAEILLFSFHGIPRRCVEKGDPYYEHCIQTAKFVAEELGLTESQWKLCFQSRFGRAEWLQPYTDELLAVLPVDGIKRVDIICPAFASDCLETLEEIEIGSRDCFMKAGGEYFARIPCLNDRDDHIKLLESIVMDCKF